jgi:hypothetical protein
LQGDLRPRKGRVVVEAGSLEGVGLRHCCALRLAAFFGVDVRDIDLGPRGSPSADWTVIRPSASALAFDPDKPNSAAARDATAVLRQRCDLEINLVASDVRAAHKQCQLRGQKPRHSNLEKYHNINVLG